MLEQHTIRSVEVESSVVLRILRPLDCSPSAAMGSHESLSFTVVVVAGRIVRRPASGVVRESTQYLFSNGLMDERPRRRTMAAVISV
jgi:hypothetical protein